MTSLDLTLPQRLSDAARQARRDGDEARLDPDDLAELIRAFNEVTGRLQRTHEALTAEVGRLQRELSSANEQLRRAQELAALGEMAAGIAHEIRNPLGSIRLYASMLQEDLAEHPQQQQVAGKIADAVRGLDAIVSDVLTFAREMRIRPAPVSAGQLIERAVDACRAALQREGVQPPALDEDIAAAELHCDPGLAHQALVNVLRNAAEAAGQNNDNAGPPRVEISVSIRQARDSAGHTKRLAAITVRDTGPGVSDDVRRRMFNPFFTTRQTGTGLGLAIVHRIVDAHGGRVAVRNHEGGGAVFELLLPAEPEAVNHNEADGSHGGEASPEKIHSKEASHEHRSDR